MTEERKKSFPLAQSILHYCLALNAEQYYGPLTISRTKRKYGSINIRIVYSNGVCVFDVDADRHDGDFVSFPGRYAAKNIYGVKVSEIWIMRKGIWVDKLREAAKEHLERDEEKKLEKFEPIDDEGMWG